MFSQGISLLALPLADRRSHAWLKRNRNPYLYEIETFADILEGWGIYSLNIAYEWGCTSGVYRTDEGVTLLRLLDWPFPELGKQVMVVLQQVPYLTRNRLINKKIRRMVSTHRIYLWDIDFHVDCNILF